MKDVRRRRNQPSRSSAVGGSLTVHLGGDPLFGTGKLLRCLIGGDLAGFDSSVDPLLHLIDDGADDCVDGHALGSGNLGQSRAGLQFGAQGGSIHTEEIGHDFGAA